MTLDTARTVQSAWLEKTTEFLASKQNSVSP